MSLSMGEGATPLVRLGRLEKELGLRGLYGKLEGCNPTGSYKDRIAKGSMQVALERRAPGWIATSSGNAAASFAAYGQRAGLPGLLCVQATIPREKLLPVLAHGVRVVAVRGVGTDATERAERAFFEAVEQGARRHGLFLGITAHRFNEAGMRAAEDIAAEVLAGPVRPDVAYVPAGGGGLVAAIARRFLEHSSGTAVVAAQPEGCAPIVRHLRGELEVPRVEGCSSHISGLQLPTPPDGELAADLVRRSGGWGAMADDHDILNAQADLARKEGVFVEPAAACGLAALRKDVGEGRVTPAACALLVLTGTGLKDLAGFEASTHAPPQVSVSELPELLSTWPP